MSVKSWNHLDELLWASSFGEYLVQQLPVCTVKCFGKIYKGDLYVSPLLSAFLHQLT